MNKPISQESIARAMRVAAWIAKHVTREERAGKFIKPQTTPPEWVSNPPKAK